jgi:hypothetical protein
MPHGMFTLQVKCVPAILNYPLCAPRTVWPNLSITTRPHWVAPHLDLVSLPPYFVTPEHPLNCYQTPISRHVHHNWTPSIASSCCQWACNTWHKIWSANRYLSSSPIAISVNFMRHAVMPCSSVVRTTLLHSQTTHFVTISWSHRLSLWITKFISELFIVEPCLHGAPNLVWFNASVLNNFTHMWTMW